jgi:ribosomal-protein-serine acetyltransferase
VSSARGSSELAFELPGRYALRALQETDLDELHTLIERNRDDLARWLSWAQEPSVERTRKYVARARKREESDGGVDRAIVLGEQIVGDVILYVDRYHDSGAIGYWLDQEHRGRGVVSAAVRSLARHAFDRLSVHRLEIRTDVLNHDSRAVAERLGFQLEGVAREAYRVDEDRYSDDAVYSMLVPEAHRLG